jgi:hypothetical protein
LPKTSETIERKGFEVFHPELRLTAAAGFAVDPGGESSVVDLSFHLRSSVDALRMKAMQMNLSVLVKQPNRSFASILLAFSLFRILHPHHANSARAFATSSGPPVRPKLVS